MNMNTKKYLERISYHEKTDPSIEMLIALHRQHVLSVPFENLDIHTQVKIELDTDKFYKKIVEKNRGGFCYELNGLFKQLLQSLGFQTNYIACSVFSPVIHDFTPYFGHLALTADLKEKWLVDVGFGDSFIEPLKIIFDQPQYQYGNDYRFRKLNEEEIVLEKSRNNEGYIPMFKFTLTPRQLYDFKAMCEFHQTSPMSPFTKGKLCSLATASGRITLTSNSFTRTENGQKKEIPVTDEADFKEKLYSNFRISSE